MIDYDEGRDYEQEDQDILDMFIVWEREKKESEHRMENLKVKVIALVLALSLVIFVSEIAHSHYEDGSGTITIGYCVPFTLCDK